MVDLPLAVLLDRDHRNDARRTLEDEVNSYLAQKRAAKHASESSLPHLHEEYNQDVAYFNHQIRKLNTRLNTLTLIARIPTELLAEIFLQYVAEFWSRYDHDSSPPYPWIVLLHVCHHWREVAAHSPVLWTWICPIRVEVVSLQLARSGDLPLTVIDNDRGLTDAQKHVLRALPRICSLRLKVTKAMCLFLSSQEMRGLHAPSMVDLHLNFWPLIKKAVPEFWARDMPKLRSLAIAGGPCKLLSTFVRPTLTELNMHLPSEAWSHQSLPSLFDMLDDLPLLRTLSLWFEAVSLDDHLPPSTRLFAFRHLATLRLHELGGGVALANFLNHISLPPACTIDFSAGSDTSSPTEASWVLSSVKTKLSTNPQAAASAIFRPRTISFYSDLIFPIVRFRVWTTAQRWYGDSQRPASDCPQESSLDLWNSPSTLLDHVLPHFDLADVTTMDIEADLPEDRWLQPFHAASGLRRLCVCTNADVHSFLAALAHPPAPPAAARLNATGVSRPLFPVLETLVLRHVCSELVLAEISDPALIAAVRHRVDPGVLSSSLVSCLVSRRETCGVLPRLVLLDVDTIGEEHVRRLVDAHVAEVVEVDGVEHRYGTGTAMSAV